MDDYLDEKGFDLSKPFAVALSGGIDSGTVATLLRPEIVFTGYYDRADCNEVELSNEIYSNIESAKMHVSIKLDESDFLENLVEMLENNLIPSAGFGGVMEYALLKKFRKEYPNIDQFAFGEGGDEIFFGYLFNYYLRNLVSFNPIEKHMSNFLPTLKRKEAEIINASIPIFLNRSSVGTFYLFSNRGVWKIDEKISQFRTVDEKLLYVNINMILLSQLHMKQAIGNSLGVKCFNPIANKDLIENSFSINSKFDPSLIQKFPLRNLNVLPNKVRDNDVKNGFKIPIDDWKNVERLLSVYYENFSRRIKDKYSFQINNFPGTNRESWAIAQAEICIELAEKRGGLI
jgi:asparagine synthetase B (glutamine-hydrolysing)